MSDPAEEENNSLPHSKSRMRFTIRVGILTFFMTIFLTFSITMLAIISYSFYQNSVSLTRQIIGAISNSVLREVSTDLNPALSSSRVSGKIISNQTINHNDVQHMIDYTRLTLSVLPQAQMVYWGDEQGNFVISRREPDGSLSSEVIDTRKKPAERRYIYRDTNGNVTLVKPITTFDYDPRKRPWYTSAKNVGKTVWSEAYLFYSGAEKTLGITSATPAYINNQLVGVFGIDVKLESISRFLSKQKISENGVALIINADGKLIAYPGSKTQLKSIHEIEQPWLASAYQNAQHANNAAFSYLHQGVRYFAATYAVPGFERHGWKIYIVIPEDDITGPVKEANMQTLILCGVLLVFGLLLISIFAKRIAVPINMLARDVERVKMFNIKTGSMIDSRIKEVFDMSSAIHAMKIGLQSFQKYVPQQLVRKLISSGEAAKLGGRNRNVTLLFSDIDNFTTISENIGDEAIMLQMCEYFDIFDKNIQESSGTVDKFIGDAIMAFWGAPEEDELQVFHACSCALYCQKAISFQNDKWVSENKLALPTRIGIHTGNVVVGNLGSRNRLNYTAIGDTVNITSRLEQLNKIYGTRTIVSEESYKLVKDQFIFRRLDSVIVKGSAKSLPIYELIEFRNVETEAKFTEMVKYFERGLALYGLGKWDEAIACFKDVQCKQPKDGPAQLFIERCQYFKDNPEEVDKDWSGVWKYTHK